MNKERLLKVADAIEASLKPEAKPVAGFNMRFYSARNEVTTPDHTGHGCGTVCCVAGWTTIVRSGVVPSGIVEDDLVMDIELNWLELDYNQTDLFYPWSVLTSEWSNIPAEQAVRTIRHLVETGVVDWTIGS